MALDNFKKTSMRIDKANQRFLDYQNAKVGDVNGRELLVQITNNGVVEDQTGTTLKLNWQHENGNQGATDFNVVDIKTGKYSLYYPKEMLYKGTVEASVEINSNGQKTNTMNFKIIVHADVFNGEAGTVDGVFISLADVNKKLDDREKEYVELKNRQNNVENQFDDIKQEMTDKDVISAPEIISARNGEQTLSARLDKEQQEVAAQLAQTANIINVDYGEVELPSDFPSLPFKLFAVDENTVEHEFNINSYKINAGEVYLDSTAPPSRDGLTPETSVKHLYQALDIAESMNQSTVIIYVMNKYYSRNYNGVNGTRNLTKNIIFSPYQREKSFIGSFEEPSLLNWEPDGKAFKTTRSATKQILDLAVPYKDTEPYPYKEVLSITDVQAEEGTFHIQGSDVWVRRIGDKAPDDDLMVLMDIVNPSFSINDKKLIFDRVSWFWFYDNTPSDGLKVSGNENSELVLYKSSFAHAHLNGLATSKIGRVYNVESKAYGNGTDGFNYHGTVPMALDPYELVYEYGTKSFDNGTNGLDNNNASTAHEGINVLRVNTLTYDTEGPIVADVNGCYSILINCISHSSRRNVSSRLKSAFFFNNTSAVKPGKAILINCGGGGKDTYAVATDVGFDLKVRRFKGTNWWSDALESVEFI